MARGIESGLAERLREIAAQVKRWEDRDVQEALARGDKKVGRPAFFHDLEMVASMLERRHREIKLTAEKAGRGRPAKAANVDRDMAIVRLIDERRQAPGGTVEAGILAATQQFNVSEGTAKAAWTRLRYALEPGNESIVPFFHKLAARGVVKITRVKRATKK